jgi:hypothetical protein
MPETPEQLYERAKDALRMPPVEEWETFPFEGELRPRPLQPPTEEDRPRLGVGGVDCQRCAATDGEYFWTSERWRLFALGPTGLPLIAMLEPREHFAEPGDLLRSGARTSRRSRPPSGSRYGSGTFGSETTPSRARIASLSARRASASGAFVSASARSVSASS